MNMSLVRPDLGGAARRQNFSGTLYLSGMQEAQKKILASLRSKFRDLHEVGAIHIHDLEGYGRAPNCLAPDLLACFQRIPIDTSSRMKRVLAPFELLRQIIADISNEQTGGIGFANFDSDVAWALERAGINSTLSEDIELVEAQLYGFLDWLNAARIRFGFESYYVTLNIGASSGLLAQILCSQILNYMAQRPWHFVRPNVVFKVIAALHLEKQAPAKMQFLRACEVAAQRMSPTFLLCDSDANKGTIPAELTIMGCRTRVWADVNGPPGGIGRGNIAYTSINLPHIALIAARTGVAFVSQFLTALDVQIENVSEQLLDRRRKLDALNAHQFPASMHWNAWKGGFLNSTGMIHAWPHGTLSVGFVGLAEAVEVLLGTSYGPEGEAHALGLTIVRHMAQRIAELRARHQENFTLLATSAESAAGRFARLDAELWKGQTPPEFYTNSFHLPVDCAIGVFQKLRAEGPFHALCSGGCISYVELSSPPIGNLEAVQDLVREAIASGCSYIGMNFPLDICRACEQHGVFDVCPSCGVSDVLRIRRVSGYLEDLDFFTAGKQAEERRRRSSSFD